MNRQKKIAMLREAQVKIIDLLLLEHKDREKINMSKFKELHRLLGDMYGV